MTYFPHTPQEIREMLNTIGLESIEDLFSEIPEEIRQKDKRKLTKFQHLPQKSIF